MYPKIIIDENIPFIKNVFEPFAIVEYYRGENITRKNILDADALIIRTRTICNRDLLEGTKVKLIATATIGFDHIDINYCKNNNIKWFSAKGCNSGSVYQYVITALLCLAGKYRFNLPQKKIGIVGCGNIGSLIKEFSDTLGISTLICDPPKRRAGHKGDFVSFEKILTDSDIITLHVPLINSGEDNTFHLFDKEVFKIMKDSCFLINTSRGQVINNIALKNALLNNELQGCVLDVWEKEPCIDLELCQHIDLATPHIAGYSADGKANGTQMVVNYVSQHFSLPLKKWEVSSIPAPENNILEFDKSDSLVEILNHLAPKTYDIISDSRRLKQDISLFEELRNNYPLRREFNAYALKGKISTENKVKLQRLGFIL